MLIIESKIGNTLYISILILFFQGQCNKRKESLLVSKLAKYIISGPALGPKPFFNRVLVNTGSCRAFLLLASSQQLVSDSFKDDQYSEGDCVIVQGSLKQNAIFLDRLYDR